MSAPDRNFRSIADIDGFDIPELIIDLPAAGIDASQYDDVLKFSNARNGHIGRLIVRTGGKQHENAIDFNRRCANIRIDEAWVEAGCQNAVTAKGNSSGIRFGHLTIKRGGHCDIELGNHSDQAWGKTTGFSVDQLESTDGTPLRIRAELADWPRIFRGAVERQLFISFVIRCYVYLKHALPFLP